MRDHVLVWARGLCKTCQHATCPFPRRTPPQRASIFISPFPHCEPNIFVLQGQWQKTRQPKHPRKTYCKSNISPHSSKRSFLPPWDRIHMYFPGTHVRALRRRLLATCTPSVSLSVFLARVVRDDVVTCRYSMFCGYVSLGTCVVTAWSCPLPCRCRWVQGGSTRAGVAGPRLWCAGDGGVGPRAESKKPAGVDAEAIRGDEPPDPPPLPMCPPVICSTK